jgi:hypothetical protein
MLTFKITKKNSVIKNYEIDNNFKVSQSNTLTPGTN